MFQKFTFVLYFGTEHRWGQKSRSLFKRIGYPHKSLKPYANDYHVNVFEIAWLSDETVAKFKSDFRIVADYCVQKRKNKNYVPGTEEIKHIEEVVNLMYAVTGNEKFERAQNDTRSKEARTMKDWFDLQWDKARLETVDLYLKTCADYGVPYDVAVSNLESSYCLSQKDAEKYARKYYPKSKRSTLQPA